MLTKRKCAKENKKINKLQQGGCSSNHGVLNSNRKKRIGLKLGWFTKPSGYGDGWVDPVGTWVGIKGCKTHFLLILTIPFSLFLSCSLLSLCSLSFSVSSSPMEKGVAGGGQWWRRGGRWWWSRRLKALFFNFFLPILFYSFFSVLFYTQNSQTLNLSS